MATNETRAKETGVTALGSVDCDEIEYSDISISDDQLGE